MDLGDGGRSPVAIRALEAARISPLDYSAYRQGISRIEWVPSPRVPSNCLRVQFEPEAQSVRDGQRAVLVEFPTACSHLVYVGRVSLVLDEIRFGQCARKLQIDSEPDGR
jgi:hypothetical protein